MRQRTSTFRWVAILLVGLSGLSGGCDEFGWVNFNVLVDLGLDGDVGLLNPFGEGSIFVPVANGGQNEPPLPIQIGGEPGGEPGGGTSGGGTGITD